MNQRVVLKEPTSTVENRWLQNNIFSSTGIVGGLVCTVTIDRGSFDNLVFQDLVDRPPASLPLFCLLTHDR